MDFRERIIQAAIRAPSGDNCQPWRFELVDDRKLRITIDADAATSFFDYKHTGTLFSLGCVLTNMELQANHDGYSMEVQDLLTVNPDEPIVEVEFQSGQERVTNFDLIDAIQARTVNRRLYSTSKINDETKKYILKHDAFEILDPNKNIQTLWYDDRAELKKWADLVYLADRIRYSHPKIHAEVFGKILLSKQEAEKKRIGLEIDRLGIGPMAKYVVMFLRPWQRMKKLCKLGVDKMLSMQSRMTALMSGAIVVVTIPNNEPAFWIEAGRRTQYLWIKSQQRKLCMQPMTVAFFLNNRYKDEGIVNFLPEHEPILVTIKEQLNKLLPDSDGVMLFRLGRGPLMKTPAIRRHYSDFIKVQ